MHTLSSCTALAQGIILRAKRNEEDAKVLPQEPTQRRWHARAAS
jgi:hypothetical protein